MLNENLTDEHQFTPKVSTVNEFIEIAFDFGDPLEIIREVISNAYDARATLLKIYARVEDIDGEDTLILEFIDNGDGMSPDILENNFWDLGNSSAKKNPEKIGEKGHGTKIFLRSSKIFVQTVAEGIATESECLSPMSKLKKGVMHQPFIRKVVQHPMLEKGTYIRIEGYHNNQFSKFKQEIVADYIYWFTKMGSIEKEFGIVPRDFQVELQMLDAREPAMLNFGHRFAAENCNIDKLYADYGHSENAVDYFVKKYQISRSLKNHPHISYNMVIYYEGDKAKRIYNPCIRDRRVRNDDTHYKVADRYGIWLSKDYIPIERRNEWITGFGSGSNAFGLLHGFINCQEFKLTANRGTVANTDINIMDEIKKEVQEFIETIDEDLTENEIYTLKSWQQEAKTKKQEEVSFKNRVKSIRSRNLIKVTDSICFLEPRNEAETFSVLLRLYEHYRESFKFEPMDYDTHQGIDIIARNKSSTPIADCEYWYIEMKFLLTKDFNHSFANLRWIICWDFNDSVKDGSEMTSTVDNGRKIMKYETNSDGKHCYFLCFPGDQIRIEVIRLKEFIVEELGLTIGRQ